MESVLPIAIVPASQTQTSSSVQASARPGLFEHLSDHFIPHPRNNYHPHIFSNRMVSLFSALLVSLKIFTIVLVSIGPVMPAYSSAITSANVISLTNQSRAGFNLQVLTENNILDKAAQAKADDMLAKGYFAHTTPDGKSPWDFIAGAGYNYITAGENLAVNFTEAENVETAWMNSPGHKANIVNKNFEEIGIGISQGQYQGHEAIFVVQMFGTPTEQKVAINDQPTVVQTQAVPAPVAAPVAKPSPVPVQKTPASVAAPVHHASVAPIVLQKELAIEDQQVTAQDGQVSISARISGDAVKVLAMYGQQAVMLKPTSGNIWQGKVDLTTVTQQNATVILKAFDMAGKIKTSQVADFSFSTQANYHQAETQGTVAGAQVSFAGRLFNPHVFQQQFYLLFITTMLVSLVLAIGIRRHVQHLGLVANGSFVVILATLLWAVG